MYIMYSPVQNLIIDSGALPELKRLMVKRDYPEIQCHVAGTFRNLAAEDQSQVWWVAYIGDKCEMRFAKRPQPVSSILFIQLTLE